MARIARRATGRYVAFDQARFGRRIGTAMTTGTRGSKDGTVVECSCCRRSERDNCKKQQRHKNRGATQPPECPGQLASCSSLIPHITPRVGQRYALRHPNLIVFYFSAKCSRERRPP